MAQMKDLYLGGKLIAQYESTGELALDLEKAREILKQKGHSKEVTVPQAMFRQAVSFASAANVLFSNYGKVPSDGLWLTPFVVNLAFCIEIYLKTLAAIHGKTAREHDLKKLFDSLDQHSKRLIKDEIAKMSPNMTDQIFVSTLTDIANAFTQWRYSYEATRLKFALFTPITVAEVLHNACQATGVV